MQRKIFAHKHLDLFYRHLFTIDEQGIEFKNKKYRWGQIEKIKVLEPGEGLGLIESTTFERLKIYLPDGKVIKINSRVLVEKNRNNTIGFISGKNDAYEELKNVIISKVTR